MRTVLTGAVEGGLRTPPVRWLMIAGAFTAGTGIYVFYALQPFLLQLYGRPDAYSVAGPPPPSSPPHRSRAACSPAGRRGCSTAGPAS